MSLQSAKSPESLYCHYFGVGYYIGRFAFCLLSVITVSYKVPPLESEIKTVSDAKVRISTPIFSPVSTS